MRLELTLSPPGEADVYVYVYVYVYIYIYVYVYIHANLQCTEMNLWFVVLRTSQTELLILDREKWQRWSFCSSKRQNI